MTVPKISIIIPCHNPDGYFTKSIQSIKKQTLQNFEVIIIIDGYHNFSEEFERLKLDERFVFIENEEQMGSGISRNKGIIASQGEYIAFLDADDFYPNSFVLQKLYCLANKKDVDICGGSLLICDPNDRIISRKVPGQFFEKSGILSFETYQHDGGFYRFIYRRDFLIKNNIFFPPYLRMQDPVFFVNAMSSSKKVFVIPEYTYVYRKNHKKVNWDYKKINDHLSAIRDLLLISRQKKFNRLHLLMCQNFINSLINKPVTISRHLKVIMEILEAMSGRAIFLGYKEKTNQGLVAFLLDVTKVMMRLLKK